MFTLYTDKMIAERLILLLLIKYILIFVVYPYICLVLADHLSRLPLMVITVALAHFNKIVLKEILPFI